MYDYDLDAQIFLKSNNIRFSVSRIADEVPAFEVRNILHSCHLVTFYNRALKKSMRVKFFQSRAHYGESPTAYDVLVGLQKYDVGSFDEFVTDFGYEITSLESYRKTKEIYKACKRHYKGVLRVFGNCLEQLREIE